MSEQLNNFLSATTINIRYNNHQSRPKYSNGKCECINGAIKCQFNDGYKTITINDPVRVGHVLGTRNYRDIFTAYGDVISFYKTGSG